MVVSCTSHGGSGVLNLSMGNHERGLECHIVVKHPSHGGGGVHYSFFHGEEPDSRHRGTMVFILFMGV